MVMGKAALGIAAKGCATSKCTIGPVSPVYVNFETDCQVSLLLVLAELRQLSKRVTGNLMIMNRER